MKIQQLLTIHTIPLLIGITTLVLMVGFMVVCTANEFNPQAQLQVCIISAGTSTAHKLPESPQRKNQEQSDTKGEQEEKEENKTECDELLLSTPQTGIHISLKTLAFFHHRKSEISLVILEKPIQPPRRYV